MVTFEETGINSDLLKAVKELGYESPTEIQEKELPLPPILKKTSIINRTSFQRNLTPSGNFVTRKDKNNSQ